MSDIYIYIYKTMEKFITELLKSEGFKDEYINMLIDNILSTPDDILFYSNSKSKKDWKCRIFKKLKFKPFTKQSDEYWIYRGYTLVEARDLSKKNKISRKNPTPMQKEFWISKGMSEDEAVFKIKSSRKAEKEFWTSRGFTIDEAIIKIKEYQLENSLKLKKGMLERPELYEDINWNQKKYWMRKGYTEKESVDIISEKQRTFSLDICIAKYGDKEGKKRWINRQEKWNKSYKKTNYSKISQDLFWEIINSNKLINTEKKSIFFATYNNGSKDMEQNREYVISTNNISIKPDFLMLPDKKIIEFDGIYWHDNKKRNKPENIKREMIREKELINIKYNVLRINENEYKNNRELTIQKCINFLNL